MSSNQRLRDDLARDVGETFVAAMMTKRQPFVIEPRQMENGRIDVVDMPLRKPRGVQRRNGSRGPLGLRESIAPLDAALLVAARRVLPR